MFNEIERKRDGLVLGGQNIKKNPVLAKSNCRLLDFKNFEKTLFYISKTI